jgi:hypothetical protein
MRVRAVFMRMFMAVSLSISGGSDLERHHHRPTRLQVPCP